MRILCPAKINLNLRVGPIGSDGYHPLVSWMCTVSLFDTLHFLESQKTGVELICDKSDLAVDQSNLIIRAANALSAAIGSPKSAKISLEKKIPLGGGLGGGSSDAGGALLGLNNFWRANLAPDQLEKIGATLGSDVPFFFHQPSSLCFGRGERIMPIPTPKPAFAVLIFPQFPMSTAAVYRKFDEMKLGTNLNEDLAIGETDVPADQLLPMLVNDLEKPAFALSPELGGIRDRLERALGRIVRMSGSGSTLFTLADDSASADEAVQKAKKLHLDAARYELAPPQTMLLA